MNDTSPNDRRPNPEALLKAAGPEGHGRLKVFLGAAPGVGKTFEMLSEAVARRDAGTDVVIGLVETHGRKETMALLAGLEVIPRRRIAWHGHTLEEMDIDGVLERRPGLVLVDELAHTNAPGSRHDKRWQDVEELLAAGIDVWSTVNIQHLESLNDLVASFTRIRVRETLPDRVLENAEIEVVDIPPDELIERLRQGKVYVPEEASRALGSFFSKSNLSALRELALRRAAQAVDAQMLDHVRAHALAGNWAVGERLVVAVNEQAGAAELVRAAKRIADALRAPWTAIHIETPRNAQFGTAENTRLADTLHLAAQLGGAVATLPAESVIAGLTGFAAEARATQLIVGKSQRSRWFELRHGSVVDQLVRATPGIAIHVLPIVATPASATRRAAPQPWGAPHGYLVALLMVMAVTALGEAIFSARAITNVGLLYLLPVMVSATRYGLRTGVVTGLASSLAYNFFFIPPTGTFTIEDPENIITVAVLMIVAVAASQLAARVRAQALLAQYSARQNSALAGFARLLTRISTPDELGHVLCAEVARLLDAQTALLMPGKEGLAGDGLSVTAAFPPAVQFDTLDHAAARWAFDNAAPAGRGSDTLTACEWRFQPIAAGERVLAVFGLARADAGAPVRPDQLPLLLSLLDQAGLALERIALEIEMASLDRLKERDRLRAALLSSVSHDLRTPLTTILGTLAEIAPADAAQAAQLASARAEAERLNRFVANLLDMVRIESGTLGHAIEPVDLAEAIAAAAHDLRRVLGTRAVRIDVAPDLPLVLVDPHLFHHCLINLIENAAKYGDVGTPVLITARRLPRGLDLMVMDEGPGLPPGMEARVFETFARLEGSDRKGGTGLGLAIVKGFAEAMGLEVAAANRTDLGGTDLGGTGRSGACFTLRFGEQHLKRGRADA